MHQIMTNLLIGTDILNNDVVKTAVAEVQRGKPWEISKILSEKFTKLNGRCLFDIVFVFRNYDFY